VAPGGLLFVGERGKPFRRSTFGRKRRKGRTAAGLPEDFRFYDLRHTGHTLSTQVGATLKETIVRAGQSTERAALIYQHSDRTHQREIADALNTRVQAERGRTGAVPDDGASGADLVQDP
jgi:integrase